MKNTMTKFKNSIESFNSKLIQAEESMKLQNRTFEIIKTGEQRDYRIKMDEESIYK